MILYFQKKVSFYGLLILLYSLDGYVHLIIFFLNSFFSPLMWWDCPGGVLGGSKLAYETGFPVECGDFTI